MAQRRNGYPMKLELFYQRRLYKMIRVWEHIVLGFVKHDLKPYVIGGNQVLGDADNTNRPGWIDWLQSRLNLLAFQISHDRTDQQLNNLAQKFIFSINRFSLRKYQHAIGQVKVQVKGQVKMQSGIVAINPLQGNRALQDYAKGKIAENTSLIKSMRSDYINKVQDDIYRSINKGSGVSDIAHQIRDRTGMTLRHADLIANDQTGTVLSQVDAYRNQQAGSEKYIWRSMEDDRVRPKHQDLDGQEFAYDDPNGGDDGQLPGEPIRCRCYADPVI